MNYKEKIISYVCDEKLSEVYSDTHFRITNTLKELNTSLIKLRDEGVLINEIKIQKIENEIVMFSELIEDMENSFHLYETKNMDDTWYDNNVKIFTLACKLLSKRLE